MSHNTSISYTSTMTRLSTILTLLFSSHGFTSLTAPSFRLRPASPSLTLPYQLGPPIETHDLEDNLMANKLSLKDLERLIASKAQTTSVSGMKIHPSSSDDSKALPLIIEPTSDDQKSLTYLQSFLSSNQKWVDQAILDHGAVLFRGFPLHNEMDVEHAIRAYNPNLNNEYHGTSPRNAQGESEYVFSAAEVPSHYPIAQHLEMSFLPSPPKQLFFSALKAPKTVGGETALADFRKVYQDIPEKLRQKLVNKKLRYTRTHHKVGETNTHDVAAMLSWPEMFGTTDKDEVEQVSKMTDMPVRWEGANKDTFVSEFTSEPFQLHPTTQEPVWFNHAQVFHWTTFPAELFAAFRRTKDARILGHALRVGAKSLWKYGIRRQKMAMHVSFGDGTPISVFEMHQIRKAVHKNMAFNRWQQGDLLMIDNFSTSHGRQPTYDKGRKIVVSWSDPMNKEQV